jgi:hypothetical protein
MPIRGIVKMPCFLSVKPAVDIFVETRSYPLVCLLNLPEEARSRDAFTMWNIRVHIPLQ